MKTLMMIVVLTALATFVGGCGIFMPPSPPPPQPVYPVYIEQQQPIVVPSTTTVNPTPVVIQPNY